MITAQLDHPNIVPVYELGSDDQVRKFQGFDAFAAEHGLDHGLDQSESS